MAKEDILKKYESRSGESIKFSRTLGTKIGEATKVTYSRRGKYIDRNTMKPYNLSTVNLPYEVDRLTIYLEGEEFEQIDLLSEDVNRDDISKMIKMLDDLAVQQEDADVAYERIKEVLFENSYF